MLKKFIVAIESLMCFSITTLFALIQMFPILIVAGIIGFILFQFEIVRFILIILLATTLIGSTILIVKKMIE